LKFIELIEGIASAFLGPCQSFSPSKALSTPCQGPASALLNRTMMLKKCRQVVAKY